MGEMRISGNDLIGESQEIRKVGGEERKREWVKDTLLRSECTVRDTQIEMIQNFSCRKGDTGSAVA